MENDEVLIPKKKSEKLNPHSDVYVIKHIPSDSYCNFISGRVFDLVALPYFASMYKTEVNVKNKLKSIRKANIRSNPVIDYINSDFKLVRIRLDYKEVDSVDLIFDAMASAEGKTTVPINKIKDKIKILKIKKL